MKIVILAGGFGTRLQEATGAKPKPMVDIGGRPILWHIMNIFAGHGFKEFILALGYKADVIKDYFLKYRLMNGDFTLHLGSGKVDWHSTSEVDWTVNLVDTGLHTETGGRVKRLARWIGGQTFILTYGDAVANVDIPALLAFHREHGKLATVTAVRPPGRFGGLCVNGEMVERFVEKPMGGDGWINGGFFILEPAVLDFIAGDGTVFEREPLERLAERGQLVAYRHTNFWQCADTPRDVRSLESLWESGRAPWKTWEI